LNCEDVRTRIWDLLLSELPPDEEIRMQQHLSECPDCRAAMERDAEIFQHLRASGDVRVPPGLKARTRRQLPLEEKADGGLSRLLNRPLRVYQTLLIVLGCLLVYSTVLQLTMIRGVRSTEVRLEQVMERTVSRRDSLTRFHSAPAKLTSERM
jgi:anti-sigma factor RsiW